MSFIKLLQGIGDKLGILESVASSESTPARRIQTRTVKLRELAGEIRSGDIQALADTPSELSIPLEEIYTAAGISGKPDDWTIEKLGLMVAEESEKAKSREDIQKAVLDRLQAKGVSTEALIRDAIARDQALDAFEARVADKMQARNQACGKRMAEIDAQIASLRQEKTQIETSLDADSRKWREWKRMKRSQERVMASSAGYIVDHPVVTTDEEE